MNKDEFDAALEASRDRLRGTGAVPSKVDNPQAVGCWPFIIIAALVLAVLV